MMRNDKSEVVANQQRRQHRRRTISDSIKRHQENFRVKYLIIPVT